MLALLLGAAGGCSHPARDNPSGTIALPLRTTVAGTAYRLNGAGFDIALVGGSVVAQIFTQVNPNLMVERRALAAGNYTITLRAGWLLEKQTPSGFQNVTAQLASPNPIAFTVVDGQTTPVNFVFLTDGVVIPLGETAVDVTLTVQETNALPVVRQLAAGFGFTCALLAGGSVRCWGEGGAGVLGYGNTNNIGDNEIPASAGDINLGGTAVEIAAGVQHVCARLSTGAVRCWGHGSLGKLGYGNTNNIGDNETPASAGDVNVGSPVLQITAGGDHTCVQTGMGAVRCWGFAMNGQLGYGNTTVIGDNEFPSFVGDINLGPDIRNAFQVAAGGAHTCSLHSTGTTTISGAVRCWGGASAGQLGYGNTTSIGDDETPPITGPNLGRVPLGSLVVAQIATGGAHTCTLATDGTVRCWGAGASGRLGYGNVSNIGDDEIPSLTAVNVGGTVVQISAGNEHTCAVLTSGGVRCWGEGSGGRLGYGNTNDIGDNEAPATAGDVAVGGPVAKITAGATHTCALLTTGAVRCWGEGFGGQLGYGNTNNIGDNEVPASAGDITVVSGSGNTTFPLTVTVTGDGAVSSNPAGIFQCGLVGGDCDQNFASGQVVTLTATPAGTNSFVSWGGACSGTAFTTTVTMSQARTCTVTFSGGTAPTFVVAGTGVEGLASLVVPYPAGLQANDLLVLQVGSRTLATTPSTPPAGFSHFDPGEATSVNAHQRTYFKFATGSETGTVTVNLENTASLPSTHAAAARIYAFRGVALTSFTESPTFITSNDGTLDGPTITTTGAGRLAVAFISLDNNPPMAPFVGETGGDWTEPVAEFGTGLGSNFAIQLQIAPMPAAGTIAGGQANFGGASDASICRAFALIGR